VTEVKVSEISRREGQGPISPLKAKVLRFLEEHPEEVFPYRDEQLARSLGVKVSALSFTLWDLHRQGLIDKEQVDGRVYFGSRQAIRELRSRLGLTIEDPFERARANAERIRARTGNIDVLELLDAVRGPWN
jgi:Mn-dependent DtxR family transcriptional regulator